MKRAFFILLIIPLNVIGQYDTLSLTECFQMAVSSNPLYAQKELNVEISDTKKSNLNRLWFPSISLEGQATYQSDVVEIDMANLPVQGFSFSAPHDQYKIYLSFEQKIYDGGLIRQQKALENSSLMLNQEQLQINFHQLKQNVSAVYFGILSISKNLELFEMMHNELNEKYKTAEVAINNGAALPSSGQILKAEILKIEQQIDELKNRKLAQIKILSELTGIRFDEKIFFEWPIEEIPIDSIFQRPENKLFDLQKGYVDQGLTLEKTLKMPKLYAFSQAGYGQPGLNMLNTEFDEYYIVGVGLKWKILDWGELNNKKKITTLQKNSIELQKENFNQNIAILMENELANIENYRNALKKDEEILILRKNIVKTAFTQFENGTITATQYLTEANAELHARIQFESHKILLAQSIINYTLIKGDI